MKRKVSFILIAFLLIVIVWCICDNMTLKLTHYTITSDRIPEQFHGFRILQVSDLHNANFGSDNEMLFNTIANENPDIIVITGDIVDSNRTNIEHAVTVAKACACVAPTYYIPGNHEARIESFTRLKQLLSDVGIIVLCDDTAHIQRGNKQIHLIGLEDPNFTKRKLSDTLSAITNLSPVDNSYTILLSHRPELFETYVQSDVDLVFSGHAHGGQFRIPFIGGVYAPGQGFFPTYDAGQFNSGNTTMIVSRGLGNSLFPIRFNNPPELVLVELQ